MKRIRAALMENRFRLMQQPDRQLAGRRQRHVRRAGAHGRRTAARLLPAEFMSAAERNDLMKNIDRWVIGASMTLHRQPTGETVVRAPVEGLGARQVTAAVAAESAQVLAYRAEPPALSRSASRSRPNIWRDTSESGQRPAQDRLPVSPSNTSAPAAIPQRLIAHLPHRLRQGRRHPDAGPRGRSGLARPRSRAGRSGQGPKHRHDR